MEFQVPQGQEKYQYVQSKFTEIAQKYDLFNDLITQGMHRYWKNKVVEATGLKKGDKALDLCCGTGDITLRLKKKVGEEGVAFGMDFSIGMLRVAVVVHGITGFLLIAGIIIHIYAAFWVKGSLKGMTTGKVSRAWAKKFHPAWYRQISGGGK